MVKSLEREPEDNGQAACRSTHCVLVEFSIAGTAEEGKRVQDALAEASQELLRDVVIVLLGRQNVPSTHIKVSGWRKRSLFVKLFG